MATLTVQAAAEAGGISFTAAAGGGDVFPNDGKTLFVVKNGDVSAATVTATAQVTATSKGDFGAVTKADAVRSVGADGVDVMGPFPLSAFNNASGQVAITYSSVTSMTVAAIRVP